MSILLIMLTSFVAMLWAANHLVAGASGIAQYYRLPPLIIGLTIVGIGTSAPEIVFAISSSFYGENDLAIGNAIGSNIANIGLVLGITILLRPLTIRSSLLRREYPLLLLIMLMTYALVLDGYLSLIDGGLLLLGCIAAFIYLIYYFSKDIISMEFKQMLNIQRSLHANILSLAIGLLVLPLSAYYLVNSTVELAGWLGLSKLIISLTIIAIGTSLPEMVTSIVAAVQGHDDIAIGNVLGSNIFNLLIVMAFPGIINPAAINHAVLTRDIPVMFLVTIILLFVNYKDKRTTARWYGGLLLLIYCCYIISLIIGAI